MGSGIPGSPLDFPVKMEKKGRRLVADGNFVTNTLGVVVALLVGVEKREEIGRNRVLGGVASKLDDGQSGRRRRNGVGGSDRVAKNKRDANVVDEVPNAKPKVGSGPL